MIHILDQKTIDKIAAGEVIERPSSIVKELMENSIDAGSTRITVEIRDGGVSMIRVTDNGSGIPAEEVRKAFLRHATSKLETAEDLTGVETLGFRGEALSTISAVTQTEMITKTEQALTGIKYVIHGGNELECTEIGAPDGTTIVSRNIFYNTPARLKFLKTNMTEGSYISDLVSHIALSHPEVSVKLISNGKTILDTTGNGVLKDTIYTLYGRDITAGLLPVDHRVGEAAVTGFIGKPFLSRGNRGFENYFVNGRYIKSPVINRAVEEAYKTYIMQHRFPFTVLFLDLPGNDCDVNVHPTKKEFKYRDEKGLFSLVFHAVRDALQDKTLIPDMNTDYGNSETIYRGNPDLMKPRDAVKPAGDPRAIPDRPADFTDRSQQNFAESDRQAAGDRAAGSLEGSSWNITESNRSGNFSGVAEKQSHYSAKVDRSDRSGGSYSILEALMPKEFRDQLAAAEQKQDEEAKREREEEAAQEEKREEVFRQAELADSTFLSAEAEPEIRVIGQVFRTYWIAEYKENLYLMDQHAAHEKVNYERFLAEFKTRTIHSQRLFPPRLFTLTAAEKTAVMEAVPLLEQTGFLLEDFGGNDVRLLSLPANLLGLSGEEVFMEMVSYISSGIEGVTEDLFVHKLATMGCKAAIKGNQRITDAEVHALLKELLELENPYTCPHGRPTLIRMTKDELDRKFKRIVG